MLSEKDRAVVDSYARCGMSLETLIISFPSFAKEDITEVYNDYIKSKSESESEPVTKMSINCS